MSATLRWETPRGRVSIEPGRAPPAAARPRPGVASLPVARRAAAAIEAGHLDEAVTLCERALADHPDAPPLLRLRGEAALRGGDAGEAVRRFRRLVEAAPDAGDHHLRLGDALRVAGEDEAALAAYRAGLAVAPDHPELHNNLGIALRAAGRMEEGIARFRRAIALKPGFAEALNNLGNALRDLDRPADAAKALERALALKPDSAEIRVNASQTFRRAGRLVEALTHARRAVELRPEWAEAHVHLGIALQERGELGAAVEAYRRGVGLDPANAQAHNNLGVALQMQGRFDEAGRSYRAALDLLPGYAEAHRHLTTLRRAHPAGHAREIEALLASREPSDTQRAHLYFALAKIDEDEGRHREAFEHWRQGNELKRARVHFDPFVHDRLIERIVETFSAELIAKRDSLGDDSRLPVFVVGMPRSGTTLVEQIVSSHPAVHGGGELGFLLNLERRLAASIPEPRGWPECARGIDAGVARRFQGVYLEHLRGLAASAWRITDKLPENFLRVGLATLLFPRAAVIHCRRNPLDTCLSNYFQLFVSGNEYSYDLRWLARYYRAYERLMAHWHAVVPDNVLDVDYEALLDDRERVTRRMIEFVGLPWDDRCLDHTRNRRPVETASSWQARQPLYTTSRDRWKRYAPWLGGLVEALGRGRVADPGTSPAAGAR